MTVVERVNDSIALQKSMQTTCAGKINTTSSTCQQCVKAHPQQPAPSGNKVEQVFSTVFLPAVKTGNLLKFLADTAGQEVVVKLFGKNIEKLGKALGSTAQQAGGLLLGGAKDLVGSVGDAFKDLGGKLTSLTSDIGHGLDNFASSVSNFGHGFEHSLQNIGNSLTNGATDAANAIAHTAENVGKQISHGVENIGHSIGHAIGHIFGRRSVCPNCDKIEGKSSQQIIDGICGSDYMTKQNGVITEINHMQNIYSASVNTTIIHKVEYDPTSIDTSQGVQFTKVFITYTVDGKPIRFSSGAHLRLTDLPTMSESLSMEIYEAYV
ncbi:hypothetical protein FSP39_018511 [Pinctada imbricata]|uniref:Uncharacterized protein n=1 Tax=Pinctada imbricata TaxID=66713 RepID=A0AA89BXK3_PINIB|nr:hypothetical protein FSP39_018511 [Pinctada imbricata]